MKKLLKFSATWCAPCKALSQNLKNANLPIEIEEIDIDENTEKSVNFAIRGVPTLVLLEDGKELKRISGVKSVVELQQFIQ